MCYFYEQNYIKDSIYIGDIGHRSGLLSLLPAVDIDLKQDFWSILGQMTYLA